ncbi:MAG: hypothetical protein AAFX93_18380, partial [Verrucomicrobiota bacterium]
QASPTGILRTSPLIADFRDFIIVELSWLAELFALDGNPRRLVYTSRKGFAKRGWEIVGKSSITNEEEEYSIRVVDQDVWLGDSVVRQATSDDLKRIRTMIVSGFIRIEQQLQDDLSEAAS